MVNSCRRFAVAAFLCFVVCSASYADDNNARWLSIEFARDSPVLPVSIGQGPITARVRGMSMALDLHTSLVLRNTSNKTICGLTLSVEAQDLTPSGRGSVTVPSLNVQPGEVFPVRIDLELLRPFNARSDGPIVQVSLDCALFSDLSAYGPDRLASRRALMVYETEARRDRQYLAGLLNSGQLAQLREELNFGLLDLNPPQLGFELSKAARSETNGEHAMAVGVVSFRGAPVQPTGGAARVAGNEVRTPQVEVTNTSEKQVRSIAMGWILRDDRGRDFVAGSVPSNFALAPVQSGRLSEQGTLRFSRPSGQPLLIGAVTAFVNDVEFADGNLWIPSRSDINHATSDPALRRAIATSPEQQRLAELYRKKGINALAAELKR